MARPSAASGEPAGDRLMDDARILAVKLADIGDLLLTTPALRLLRNSYPKAHIAALVPPRSVEVLKGSDLVNELIVFDQHRYDSPGTGLRPTVLFDGIRQVLSLRRARFDCVILFHHLVTTWGVLKYAGLCLASGAHRRVGLDDGRGRFLTHRVPDYGFGAQHEADYCLSLARAAGARGQPPGLELQVSSVDREYAERTLRDLPHPRVAIHPGSGGYSLARRWPALGFAKVADGLTNQHGAGIVLVGGQEERKLGAEVSEMMLSRPLNLVGQTSLAQLAAILAHCDLLVSNDSGVAHVGVASGASVVAVFGPSNHRAWAPYDTATTGLDISRGHTVVRVNVPCSPCIYVGQSLGLRHGCATRDCLLLVTPAMVLEASLRALEQRRYRLAHYEG